MRSSVRPAIHILAGENVCIQAMTPTQVGDWSASRSMPAIASGVETTGFGDDADRDLGALVEAGGDDAGVGGDLLEDLGPVEVLAARDEPDLEVVHDRAHRRAASR